MKAEELSIKQLIFAKFIEIEEIEKAIEYAENSGITLDEKRQAMEYYKEKKSKGEIIE